MKIYRIKTEHSRWGANYSHYNVAASTAEEAIKKAKKEFGSGERVEEIQLLAEAQY